jgi:hypothetical protein
MRVWAVALGAAAVAAWATPARADCDDPFGDPTDVLSLHVRMAPAVWDQLVFDGTEGSGCDAQYPYREVEFRCGDDEPWLTIGARHKRGDQRGRDTDYKPPLKLDFNRIVQGQRWPAARGKLGYRKLSLNNGQADNPGGALSALMSEHFAWRLMRREVGTASGVAYARLYVHLVEGDSESVEYHGIYIVLEDVDRTAIRARFGADQGTLLKTTTGGCRDQIVFDDGAPNAATDSFDAWLALDPGGSYDGGWRGETERHIHLESALRQEALRDALANGRDTLFGQNYSNYHSFDPSTGTRHYIPWDLDDAFRIHPQTVPFDTPLDDSCSPIGALTRCNADIEPRYLEVMCQLANGTLHEDALVAEWDAIDALLRPIVAEEVDPVWAPHGIDPLDADQAGTYAAEYVRVRQWIQDRVPYVRGQIEASGVTCPDGCTEAASETCEYLTCAGERRCESGRWTTCQVDPGLEICGNGADDDCDFRIDEGCTGPGGDGDGGPITGDGGPAADDVGGSCGCQSATVSGALPWELMLVLLFIRRRTACRWRRPGPCPARTRRRESRSPARIATCTRTARRRCRSARRGSSSRAVPRRSARSHRACPRS